ncbi:PQQ-binding-like beta-propeller repeat protein [Actinoplanes sp. NPDC051346]|uniref:outer membrane protein assembly factor BamB family protein n=1 Tax=Actinoplanes sp. NPDC051346 TaxID=3155048 RepID=UPI003420203E
MTDNFPLPVRWRATLPSFCLVWEPPVPDGDQVVARCGEAIVAFGADRGDQRWRAELGSRTGDGTCLVSVGDHFVTDVIRRPQRLSSLIAVRRDGTVAWRVDLPGQVIRGSVAATQGDLLVLGREPGAGQFLYRLDPATGDVRGRHRLPWAATALAPLGDSLLLANGSDDNAPGLFRTTLDGGDPQAVSDEPVARLIAAGDQLLTLSRGGDSAVRMHDPATLAVRWSAPARDVAALDGDAVFAVADGALVSWDAGTGTERWRSEPLPEEPGRLAAAGGIVLYGHLRGNGFYRGDDGTLLGETTDSYGAPAAAGGRIYAGGQQMVLCADASARLS